MAKVKLYTVKCLRCGHEWIPRTTDVRSCASCHSALWDVKPKVTIGKRNLRKKK